MRDVLAHGLRRAARWLIKTSNRLAPPTTADLAGGFKDLLLANPDGSTTVYNISGVDLQSAAAAVEREQRRQALAAQRLGGFGR